MKIGRKRHRNQRSLAEMLSTPAARIGYEQEILRGELKSELGLLFPDSQATELIKQRKLPFKVLFDPQELTVQALSRVATSCGKRLIISFIDLPEVDMLAGFGDDIDDSD